MILREYAFRRWLEKQPPSASVGLRGNSHCCPLAKYLDARTGNGYWAVYPNYYSARNYLDGCAEHKMPAWATEFVKRVDRLHRIKNKVITARRALRVLNDA